MGPDLFDGLVERQPRFGADDEQIERIGKAEFEARPPPRRDPRDDRLGKPPAGDKARCQHRKPHPVRAGEIAGPLQEQPEQHDKADGGDELRGDQRREVVMALEPGRRQLGEQFLLLGRVDQLLCRNHDAETAIPRHRGRQGPALRGAAAQPFEAALAVLALADAPQPDRANDRRRERRDQDRAVHRIEIGAGDAEGQPGAEHLVPGGKVDARKHRYRATRLMMIVIVARPDNRNAIANPSTKRPRGSMNSDPIRAGFSIKQCAAGKKRRRADRHRRSLRFRRHLACLAPQLLPLAHDAAQIGERLGKRAAGAPL